MRIGREFLDDIEEEARLGWPFAVLMAISGTLAAVALLVNSVPLLIGAMVVAPAYPPLSLAAFGICAGSVRLSLKGVVTALIGIAIALLMSAFVTLALNWMQVLAVGDNLVGKPLLEERLRPGWYSIIVGVAAGLAGAVAAIKNKKDVLVGVVAAVALIPAGSAAMIALVSGDDSLRVIGGLTLLFVNFGLIIATGVVAALFMESDLSHSRKSAAVNGSPSGI